MTDLSGQTLGRYRILEPLGKGGMAFVYKAHDTTLERTVAIKVLRSDQFGSAVIENMLQRFKREARALTRLSHPNIVGVMDYGDHEGIPYLVMEYLPGGTLKEKMKARPMHWREAARLLIPICRALQYAHDEDLIHRDIKPSNIILTQSGEPMLTDFGIAKVLDVDQTTEELTVSGIGIGTPNYMAPEQAFGQIVDGRADVYALGVIFYELVTGRLPYHADTPMAVLLKKSSEPLPSPRKFNPHLPEDVERSLIKALQKDPTYRYQSATEFLKALERIVEGGASPINIITAGLPFKRIALLTVILVGILGLLGLAAIIVVMNFMGIRQRKHLPIRFQKRVWFQSQSPLRRGPQKPYRQLPNLQLRSPPDLHRRMGWNWSTFPRENFVAAHLPTIFSDCIRSVQGVREILSMMPSRKQLFL